MRFCVHLTFCDIYIYINIRKILIDNMILIAITLSSPTSSWFSIWPQGGSLRQWEEKVTFKAVFIHVYVARESTVAKIWLVSLNRLRARTYFKFQLIYPVFQYPALNVSQQQTAEFTWLLTESKSRVAITPHWCLRERWRTAVLEVFRNHIGNILDSSSFSEYLTKDSSR